MSEVEQNIVICQWRANQLIAKSIDQVYIAHEKEKKRAYNERVLTNRKGHIHSYCDVDVWGCWYRS